MRMAAMSRWGRWAIWGAAGVVLLLLAVGLLVPRFLNAERYRELIAVRIGKALGRPVSLGEIRLSLFPLPAAEVRGIRVEEQPGFGAEPFVEAESLQVRVRILPLLRGAVVVKRVVLEKPRIRLTRASSGRWSVDDLTHPSPARQRPTEPAAPPAPALTRLAVGQITISGGSVTVTDASAPGGRPAVTELHNLSVTIAQEDLGDPLSFRVRGVVGEKPATTLELRGTVAAASSGAVTVGADLTVRNLDLTALRRYLVAPDSLLVVAGRAHGTARVAGPWDALRIEGSLDLTQTELVFPSLLRKGVGEVGSVTFHGQRQAEEWQIRELGVTVKKTSLRGRLSLQPGPPTRIRFHLESPGVDLDALQSSVETTRGVAWAASRPTPAPSPATAAKESAGMVAEGDLALRDLRWKGVHLTDVTTRVHYTGTVVKITDLRATLYGGSLKARGEVRLGSKLPHISLTSRLDRVQAEPLLRAVAGLPWGLKGTLTVDSSLTLVGAGGRDALGSATGQGSLLLTQGKITGYPPLEKISEVLSPILRVQGMTEQSLNEFEKLSGRFSVDKGSVHTRDLTLTRKDGSLKAIGTYNLLDTSLNFDVIATLPHGGAEAKVMGTVSKPLVVPKLARVEKRIETELGKILKREDAPKDLKEILRDILK